MSSLVHVIGLMPSLTAIASSQQGELRKLAAQMLRRLEGNAVDAKGARRLRVARIVVDEDRFFRRDAMPLQQNPKDARIGLDDTLVADTTIPSNQDRKGKRVRCEGNVSDDQFVSAYSGTPRCFSSPRSSRCLRSRRESSRRSAGSTLR
jgi:hypothetical protein